MKTVFSGRDLTVDESRFEFEPFYAMSLQEMGELGQIEATLSKTFGVKFRAN